MTHETVQLYPAELVRIHSAPGLGASVHSARGSAYLGTLAGIDEGGVHITKDPHAPGPYELRYRQTGRTSRMMLRAVESFLDPNLEGDTLVVVYSESHIPSLSEKAARLVEVLDPSGSLLIEGSRGFMTATVGSTMRRKTLIFMGKSSFLQHGPRGHRFSDVFVDDAIHDAAWVGGSDTQVAESAAVANKAKRIRAGMSL